MLNNSGYDNCEFNSETKFRDQSFLPRFFTKKQAGAMRASGTIDLRL